MDRGKPPEVQSGQVEIDVYKRQALGAAFTAEQIKKRAAELEAICIDTLPNEPAKTWRARDLARDTASNACADVGSLSGPFGADEKPHGFLKSRLHGECWHQVAIILIPDRRWSDRSMWAMRSGLSEDIITRYPKAVSYTHLIAPVAKIAVNRALRRQVFRNIPPLASCA